LIFEGVRENSSLSEDVKITYPIQIKDANEINISQVKNILSLRDLDVICILLTTNILSLTGQSQRDWILVEEIITHFNLSPIRDDTIMKG